jgi:hypothetical protein
LPELASKVDAVAIVRSLAHISTPEHAAEHMPPYIRDRLAPEAAVGAVETVVAHAADLTRKWRLLPPAEVVFLREHRRDVSELDAVRALASRLLESLLDPDNLPPEEIRAEDRKTAFYYAAALLKQERVLRAVTRARSEAPTLDGALSGMDRKRVEDLLLSRSMSGPVNTLARLMSVWQHLVEQIERDRDMGYEDYEQALIARDYLEDAVSLLSPDAREGLDVQLRPLDEGFAAGTGSLATSIRPSASWEPQPWWWFRVPRPMGDSFQARLEHVSPAAAQEARTAQEDASSQPGRQAPS